jgi:leucyl aminopeptidase
MSAVAIPFRTVPAITVADSHAPQPEFQNIDMFMVTKSEAEAASSSGSADAVTLIAFDRGIAGMHLPDDNSSDADAPKVVHGHVFDGPVTMEGLMSSAAALARSGYGYTGTQQAKHNGKSSDESSRPARSLTLRLSKGVVDAVEGGATGAVFAASLGAMLGDYAFDHYKTDRKSMAGPLSKLSIVSGAFEPSAVSREELDSSARRAAALGSGCWLARDTAAELSDVATPAALEATARAVAQEAKAAGLDAEITCITGADELEARGMNMFAAVGQAAGAARDSHAPRLILLKLRGGAAASDSATVACLGKAVTHDSGGLNLKPTGSIETMHMDKGGGAAVLGAALAAIRSGAVARSSSDLVFAVAAAENAIDALSYKPHAILTSAKGSTVEVSNTDAEGRLVLADAMTHLQREHGVKSIVDVATLTGACVMALGQDIAGLFSNDEALATALTEHAAAVGEPVWRLPVLPSHHKALKGVSSDLRSTGKSKGAGASTAAAFLEHFVEEGVRWAHLDIAGPGMREAASGIHCAGATGYASMTLASWIDSSTRA